MSEDPFDLAGRVALITGGGTGIGRATALLFARHGADVVLASRKQENLDRVAGEVRALGRRALPVATDVRKPEQITALVDRSIAEFGHIDLLINNAGGSYQGPIEGWKVEHWDSQVNLNLRSVYLLSQACVRHMIPRRFGRIVNISSGAARIAIPYVAPYAAAKAGVENLTMSMAAAWGRHNIRVNCIAVGAIKSEGFLAGMAMAGQDPDVVGGRNALARAGEPEEIAWPVLFLVSEASSYMTGQTFGVNGGPAAPATGF
jgi:NAD(P)-dependent dehydrogenase (short-subunit alcohol dehydrogenase family)